MSNEPAKHTPGPWHIANGVQVRSQRDQIAKVWMMRRGEGGANARLIAAAPDLLEALKELLDQDDHGEDEIWVRNKARAAIAKAEGEKS